MVALALVVLASFAVLGGDGHRASVTAARADASGVAVAGRQARAASRYRSASGVAVARGRARAASRYRSAAAFGGPRTFALLATLTYVNPLLGAHVKPERIDMGVDYAGSGTLVAIGAARLTYMATSGTGWPGAFIEYRLLDGPDAGGYVYYAEGVIPAPGLHVGQTVAAGQAIASIIPDYPTGIELGWGAGASTKTYAEAAGQWSASDDEDNVASAAGKSFSALIAGLGGPAGKVEG
jgi:hypothetical protein